MPNMMLDKQMCEVVQRSEMPYHVSLSGHLTLAVNTAVLAGIIDGSTMQQNMEPFKA